MATDPAFAVGVLAPVAQVVGDGQLAADQT
jgi:hypothetical protein